MQIKNLSNQKDLSSIKWLWGGLKLRDRWSAVYSGHGWYTKFRSMHCLPGNVPTKQDIENTLLDGSISLELASRTEHTRWMYERMLMMGECIMTDKSYHLWEQKSDMPKKHGGESERTIYKNELKNSRTMEHLDICSFWQLQTKDAKAVPEDK